MYILSRVTWNNFQAKLSDEQAAKLKEHRKICLDQTVVDAGKIEAARKGQFVDDAKVKDYLVCVSKRMSFLNDAGNLQHPVLKAKVGAVFEDQNLADKLDAECAVEKTTPQETIFELAKCYYEKNPKHVVIF